MVNPVMFANSSAVSLSALLGGGSAVSSSNNADTSNNFENIINGLLSGQSSASNQPQTADTISTLQVKSALYQAFAMLYITGGISNIASQDTSSIAKNMVVSNVIQNNNLTPAQTQIFLTTLKSAAMSMVSDPSILASSGSGKAPADVLAALTQNANEPATANLSYQKVPAGNVSAGRADGSSNDDNSQFPAALVYQQAIDGKTTVDNQVPVKNTVQVASSQDNEAALASDIPVSQQTDAPTQAADALKSITAGLNKLQDLTNTIVNILTVKISGTNNNSAAGNTAENAGTTSLSGMIKQLNDDIANALRALSAVNTGNSQQTSAKTLLTVKNLMDDAASTLNSLMAAAAAMQLIPQTLTQPAAVAPSNDISISNRASNGNNAMISLSSNSGNGYSNQGGNTGITSSNQPQINDLASKITALLKEMNGKLEVISKYEYAAADYKNTAHDAVELTPNGQITAPAEQVAAPANNTVPESAISFKGRPDENVRPAQIAVQDAQPSQQKPSVQPVEIQPITTENNNGNNAAAVLPVNITIAPETMTALNTKNGADNDNKNASAVIKDPDVAQPVPGNTALTQANPLIQDAAVTAAAQLLNNDSTKYQPGNTSKNLADDINWLANNMIKPALTADASMTSTLAAAPAAGPSFTNMAAFAKSAMDQVVLKQVVTNLNNSQPVKIDEIRMTLRPENLGTVIVKIDHSNNEIKGSFMVSNNDVKDALKAGLPDLKNTLNNLGIKTDSINVTVSDSNAGAYDHGTNGQYNEWEGAVAPSVINDFNGNVDAYFGGDGSFNYLA